MYIQTDVFAAVWVLLFFSWSTNFPNCEFDRLFWSIALLKNWIPLFFRSLHSLAHNRRHKAHNLLLRGFSICRATFALSDESHASRSSNDYLRLPGFAQGGQVTDIFLDTQWDNVEAAICTWPAQFYRCFFCSRFYFFTRSVCRIISLCKVSVLVTL